MINRFVCIGRFVRDPEMKTTTTGKSVVEFTVAVNKRMKPQDGSPDSDFFRCKAWGQTAEYVSNYLHKGRLVALDGRIEQLKYTDSSGANREIFEIVCDSVQGLDRPREDAQPATTTEYKSAIPEDEYDPFA